jgi:beta-N-acetylhexosaminidase
MDEMRAVASVVRPLSGKAKLRAAAALARLPRRIEPFDIEEARHRFEAAFAGKWAA